MRFASLQTCLAGARQKRELQPPVRGAPPSGWQPSLAGISGHMAPAAQHKHAVRLGRLKMIHQRGYSHARVQLQHLANAFVLDGHGAARMRSKAAEEARVRTRRSDPWSAKHARWLLHGNHRTS